jgi:hypothetical protein
MLPGAGRDRGLNTVAEITADISKRQIMSAEVGT